MTQTPVIDLSKASGRHDAWDRPAWMIYLWAACEVLVLRNALQPSSALRARVLRAFGARIGQEVILRPGLRVKFPWKLKVGDRSWIGEDVWLHNQDALEIGSDTVISQQAFITTGTHAYRGDMALTTRPVVIGDGVWVTARCIVLAGSHIGTSALILPNAVVSGEVPDQAMYGPPRSGVVGQRLISRPTSHPQPSADGQAEEAKSAVDQVR